MKRAITILVSTGLGLALLLSVVLAGPAKKPFTIAFVPGITTDAFYISMKVGAEQAAGELGDKLIWQGASSGGLSCRHQSSTLSSRANPTS